jgi:serine/threonine protein phosphatase PrpC
LEVFRPFEERVNHGPVRVTVFGKTDLGRAREHNEDTFLVADLSTGNASLQPEVRRHEIGPRGSLFMVADGMGGAAAGELASAMAADLIYRHMATKWASDPAATPNQFAHRMREAVELANGQIYSYAREHPAVRGMGTTVTAAGVFATDLYLTQIGDSRAYLVRGDEAVQLTKDQSLMQRLVDAGELTQDEAEQSERRNIILQALGPDPRVKVDLTHQPIRRGDILILCSDGLSGLVRREEFAQMAREHVDPSALCSALIDLANARGGPDNITVVAARFEGDGLPEANGGDGVGHQRYHPGESAAFPEPASTASEEVDPTDGPVTDLAPERVATSSAPPNLVRTVALILISMGVLLLLLAVWR